MVYLFSGQSLYPICQRRPGDEFISFYLSQHLLDLWFAIGLQPSHLSQTLPLSHSRTVSKHPVSDIGQLIFGSGSRKRISDFQNSAEQEIQAGMVGRWAFEDWRLPCLRELLPETRRSPINIFKKRASQKTNKDLWRLIYSLFPLVAKCKWQKASRPSVMLPRMSPDHL
jgi:hypothetical protein